MPVVHLASDHAGHALKELLARELPRLDCTIKDHGTNSGESCDYPVFAHKLCDAVLAEGGLGILVCGIRAALCTTELHARLSRRHNDANVLCLGARITGDELALAIVVAFLETAFEGGRHQRRIGQITPRA